MQVSLHLENGEKNEVVFRLGAASHLEDISYLIHQGRGKVAAREALEKVKGQWETSLSVIQVDSPDLVLKRNHQWLAQLPDPGLQDVGAQRILSIRWSVWLP